MGWFQDRIIEPLMEGFTDRAAAKVRADLSDDKDKAAQAVRRSAQPGTGKFTAADSYGYHQLSEHLQLEQDLRSRFIDYEDMDDAAELHTALDIYADDTTQEDALRNSSVWVTSNDARVSEIAEELFHETLRINEEIWGISRTLCKYGNGYAEILLGEDGVVGLAFMPPATVRRMEDPVDGLLGFIQDPTGTGMPAAVFKKFLDKDGSLTGEAFQQTSAGFSRSKGSTPTEPESSVGMTGQSGHAVVPFESWEVVHWRLRGRWMKSLYGHGVLESARSIWRKLTLLEDAALLYKLTRAPARYAFYIDVGEKNDKAAMAYVDDIRRGFKKKKYVNKDGKLEFKVNPLAQDEDFFLPTRAGREGTRIDILSGADWQSMDDIRYFRQKLLAAIKISASHLNMADGNDDAGSSVSSQDVRFAKTCLRVQRAIKAGLRHVLSVHLSAKGIDPKSVKWDVHMAVPSAIFELAQIEVRNAQADLAGRMQEWASKEWIMNRIFDFNDDEIDQMTKEKKLDMEDTTIFAAKVNAKAAKIVGGDAIPVGVDNPTPSPPQPAQDPEDEPETSREKGTGDTRPSPGKGKPTRGADAEESISEMRSRLRKLKNARKNRGRKSDRALNEIRVK